MSEVEKIILKIIAAKIELAQNLCPIQEIFLEGQIANLENDLVLEKSLQTLTL